MTDDELKALVASLAVSQKETGLQIAKLRASQQETDRQLRETDHQLRATDKKIGGLGGKFRGFTEGMAFPSIAENQGNGAIAE